MVTSSINTSQSVTKKETQSNFVIDLMTSICKKSDEAITSAATFALHCGKNYNLKFRKDQNIKLFDSNDASDLQKLRIIKTILAVASIIGIVAILNISLPLLSSAVIISAQFIKENLLEVSTAIGAIAAIDKQINSINSDVNTIKNSKYIIDLDLTGKTQETKQPAISEKPITKQSNNTKTDAEKTEKVVKSTVLGTSESDDARVETKGCKNEKVNGVDEYLKFVALYNEIENKSL